MWVVVKPRDYYCGMLVYFEFMALTCCGFWLCDWVWNQSSGPLVSLTILSLSQTQIHSVRTFNGLCLQLSRSKKVFQPGLVMPFQFKFSIILRYSEYVNAWIVSLDFPFGWTRYMLCISYLVYLNRQTTDVPSLLNECRWLVVFHCRAVVWRLFWLQQSFHAPSYITEQLVCLGRQEVRSKH